MSAPQAKKRGILLQLIERIGNPLEWSQVDRTILVVVLTLTYEIPYVLLSLYLLRYPDLVPFIDSRQLRHLTEWVGVPSLIWWAATIAAGLATRRRHPESRLLVHTTIQFWWISISIAAYFLGSFTSPFAAVAFLGAAFLGFLIYDRAPVLFGVATGSIVMAATTFAEQAGYLPYAPLFSGYAYELGGHLSPWWVLAVGLPSMAMTLTLISISFFLITNWRERERRLAAAFEELHQTKDQLVRAESLAAVGSLVAGAAHELRNPLASSGSLIQSVVEDLGSDRDLSKEERADALKALQMALTSEDRARDIVDRLYYLTDDLAQTHSLGTVGELLDGISKIYEGRAAVTEPEAPREIPVNRHLLQTVLTNILDNAIAAGGTESPRLSTGVTERHLIFAISDSGCGIPRTQQAEVFKPFFTGKKTGKGHGVGLGLYIVHELVTRMGGTVALESEEGKGTRVTLKIPAVAS